MHKSTKWSKKQLSMFFLVLAMGILLTLFFTIFVQAAASGTHEPTTGVTVGVSGATDNSMSNGAVTVTAKGSSGFLGIGASSKTATITVTNSGSSTATVSFDWTATSVNQLVIDGNPYTGTSGSFSKLLDAGASFTITITTAKNGTTNKLVMSNFAWVEAKSSSNVTIEYDSNLGSVTAGGDVASGDTIEVSLADGAVLTATPQSGKTFVGWIDTADNKVISKTASFTCKPADDITIKAVFVDSNTSACFWANEATYLFESLNSAIEYTDGVSSKVIVLAATGTLPSGNYTIPSGVTLLIPFDDANTLIKDDMGSHVATSNLTRELYRQLTMASGAKITVESGGAISIGSRAYRQMTGQVGPYGAIVMESSSNITINSGANLYAWGYIFAGGTGAGSVTVLDGGTVYEDLTIMDYTGDAGEAQDRYNKDGIFPMRSYTARNVEVPMTYYYGAKSYVFYCLWSGSLDLNVPGKAAFIGKSDISPALELKEGATLVKSYVNGKQHIIITGNCAFNAMSVKIGVSELLATTVKSSNTSGVPLPSGFIMELHNGTMTLNDNILMMEGTKFTVAEDAVIDMNGKNVYVFDAADDKGAYTKADTTIDVHGNVYTQVNEDAVLDVNGKIIASGGLYTTTNGASIISR